jgi:hypothetical protein
MLWRPRLGGLRADEVPPSWPLLTGIRYRFPRSCRLLCGSSPRPTWNENVVAAMAQDKKRRRSLHRSATRTKRFFGRFPPERMLKDEQDADRL